MQMRILSAFIWIWDLSRAQKMRQLILIASAYAQIRLKYISDHFYQKNAVIS